MKWIMLGALFCLPLYSEEIKPKSTKEILSGKRAIILGKQNTQFEINQPQKKSVEQLKNDILFAKEDAVRASFAQMSLQAKCALIKEMNIMQYHWFLVCFSEEEWQQMHQKLPADQQVIIPRTRREQLAAIRDVWMICSLGFGLSARYATDAQVRDLAQWREKTLKEMINTKCGGYKGVEQRKQLYFQWIERLLFARKLALLKEITL